METNEEMCAILESRAYNYLLFQNVFGSEPTEELIETVCGDIARQSFEIFAVESESPYTVALLAANQMLADLRTRSETMIERIGSTYTNLYLGPGNLKAPPWESIYVSKQRLLFQESTLAVRNAYRAQGFLPTEYPRVADDHLALEFAFMAKLGDRAKTAYSDNETETVRTALEASRQFMEDHLLVWVPNYMTSLAKIEEILFYPIMTALALEFLKVDKNVVDELIGELQDESV